MSTPVLHVLAGPNGSGKTTFAQRMLQPVTGLPFINADVIAAERWPNDTERHAYEAAAEATAQRQQAIAERRSFITETVFSHPSKVELVAVARAAGYFVELHVMMIPEEAAVARVAARVRAGGHPVPEHKIRERYRRLWPLVMTAAREADRTTFYDNTSAAAGQTHRPVAVFERGSPVGVPGWPAWVPPQLAARDG